MLEVYTQYRGDIQTGDAIFFSGKGAKSDLIKFFSKGEWSHIGMAYRPVEHLLL